MTRSIVIRSLFAICGIIWCVRNAYAGPLVLGALPTEGGSFIEATQTDAEEFSLTQPVDVDGITLFLAGAGTDEFTMYLTTAIGPLATAGDVLAQENSTLPDAGFFSGGAPVTIALTLSLAPGNYFIVLSSNAPDNLSDGWISAGLGPIQNTPAGTAGPGYPACCPDTLLPPASSFSLAEYPIPPFDSNEMFSFELTGSVACLFHPDLPGRSIRSLQET
jgi:hypothetical protein